MNTCKHCGKEFEPSILQMAFGHEVKFCSKACYRTYRKLHANPFATVACQWCGKLMVRPRKQLRRYGAVFCNNTCRWNSVRQEKILGAGGNPLTDGYCPRCQKARPLSQMTHCYCRECSNAKHREYRHEHL